ncbi:MAG: GNAT family N-acetyltransferase [Lachnospiraceae bacterium]|nr:GNAT family N-acetyltransferase [Lachnospiraceae bacterium]
MEYIKATCESTECVFDIVQNTVTTIYPKYYPKEVVEFFCELHNRENIAKDIENGNVGILMDNNQIVGTGSHEENHITRVYVLPKFQGKGYGSFIMQCLEDEISAKYHTVLLDASLPASHLYEQRGYRTVMHKKWLVENDVVLVYEVMEKALPEKTANDCTIMK